MTSSDDDDNPDYIIGTRYVHVIYHVIVYVHIYVMHCVMSNMFMLYIVLLSMYVFIIHCVHVIHPVIVSHSVSHSPSPGIGEVTSHIIYSSPQQHSILQSDVQKKSSY